MEDNGKITIKDLTTEEALQTLVGKGKSKPKLKKKAPVIETATVSTSSTPPPPPPPPPPAPKQIDVAPSAKGLVESFQPRPVQEQHGHEEPESSVSWSSIVLLVAGGFLVGWGVCRVARAIFSTGNPSTVTAEELLSKLTPEQLAELINA